jgi:hypothetical protein
MPSLYVPVACVAAQDHAALAALLPEKRRRNNQQSNSPILVNVASPHPWLAGGARLHSFGLGTSLFPAAADSLSPFNPLPGCLLHSGSRGAACVCAPSAAAQQQGDLVSQWLVSRMTVNFCCGITVAWDRHEEQSYCACSAAVVDMG